MNDFYFIHYQDWSFVDIYDGIFWRVLPEFKHGFYTHDEALFFLREMSDEPLHVVDATKSRFVENMEWYFPSRPHIKYRIFEMGIAYVDGPSVHSDNPWYVGALRERSTKPVPQHLLSEKFALTLPDGQEVKVSFFSG